MKSTMIIILLAACTAVSAKKPEMWLTPERRAALKTITHRPAIIKQEVTADGLMIYTWTNGLHGCVTTQKLDKVLGKPSKDTRKEKLDALKAERDALKVENENLKKQKKGPTQ